VAGVTGARTDLPPGLIERVQWLRTKTDVPILVGFGISTPEQAQAVASVADGVIVGSAVVRQVAEAAGQSPDRMVGGLERYVRELVAAVSG
jgi:tryptophan synthase alpha chain